MEQWLPTSHTDESSSSGSRTLAFSSVFWLGVSSSMRNCGSAASSLFAGGDGAAEAVNEFFWVFVGCCFEEERGGGAVLRVEGDEFQRFGGG